MNNERINEVISEQSNAVLLRAKGTSRIYATVDGVRFENLTDGVCGTLTQEEATGVFTIPIQLNAAHQQNKYLIELIKTLKLAIEV